MESSISSRCFSGRRAPRLRVSAPRRIIESGVRSSCETFATSAARRFIVSVSRRSPRMASSMPRGVMETAMSDATSVLPGVLGTMAANISTTTPIQLIIGNVGMFGGSGLQ